MSQGSFFEQLFESIAERGREFLSQTLSGTPRNTPSLQELSALLLAQRGEATVAALAQRLVTAYQELDEASREAYFTWLAETLNPDAEDVLAAAQRYREERSPDALIALGRVCEAPRQTLFRRMNMAADGTAALVDLRAALLDRLKEEPSLKAVDDDLLHLFGSWFNRGFLMLKQIDWRTPAFVLEKLIAYESVHEIQGWEDLRRRLAQDRRCFAFFHPVLADEPLIFVEVALVKGMAASVHPLLDADKPAMDPKSADTAIFYSINNCQKGLRGVSFGNFLIKQVAAELNKELPNLKTFATLSPIPGFRRWLLSDAVGAADGNDEVKALIEDTRQPVAAPPGETRKDLLMRLVAHYLTRAKRRDGWPLDPVARFHLGNGARMERINWQGDLSPNGLQQSAGLMVNYLYGLDDLERNHEAYVNRKQVVAARAVDQLAKSAASMFKENAA
ncbi:MAG: malonyl-CoA decarboxylase [Hyphomicrobiales bacterium]